MLRKQKISSLVYGGLLIPIFLISFFLSGLFRYSGVTVLNFGSYLNQMFADNFIFPWRYYNAKTPVCLGMGLLVWIFLVSYLQFHYRNFQTGKEYGVEDWADPVEVTRRRSEKEPRKNRILSQNLQVAKEGVKAPPNNNMLVMGSAGTYKTTSIVTQNILQASDNYIVLDVKGELMYKYGLYLQSKGYTIRCLNLKDQSTSDRYNPFAYIEKEEDVIKLVANIYDALTPPQSATGDPFWQDGAMLYLQSLFFYVWIDAQYQNEHQKPGEKPKVGTMNDVMRLVNMESQKIAEPTKETPNPPSKLQKAMEELASRGSKYANNPATRDYRKLKEGAPDTVRSIVIIVNAKLKLMEVKSLQRIFEADEISLREFAYGVGGSAESPTDKKLALFLCVNDNDKSYNFICSMLYTQAMEILCRIADTEFRQRGGKLPIPLEVWMDEFYAGARPHDTESLMGIVRSRNISLIPLLQSKAQLEDLFPNGKWEIIMDNCPTVVFLGAGAGALETHKYISELLGKMTIDTMGDGKSGMQLNANYNRTGAELMTPAAVKRMDKKYCIIFLDSEYPIYDRKALPWEKGNDGNFNEANRLNMCTKDGGYVHPVITEICDDGTLVTIRTDQRTRQQMTPLPSRDQILITLDMNLDTPTREEKEAKTRQVYQWYRETQKHQRDAAQQA